MKILDQPDFTHLPEDASDLFRTAAEASFFNLPEWYSLVAARGLEPGRAVRVYLGDGAGLVVSVRTKSPYDIRSCCTLYTTEHAVLHRDTASVRALAAELAKLGAVHTIHLSGLDPEQESFPALLEALRDAGFAVSPHVSWVNRFEPLGEGGFDAYLEGRPSELKNTARRKLSALQRAARTEFRTHSDIDSENFIGGYEAVYRKSWKTAEPYPGFIPTLIRLADEKGALRFGVLTVDDEPVAAQFWIVWRGRAILYKLAYDEKWGRYSPGTLLTMRMVRDVIEQDTPRELDFGRGDDPYKTLWMPSRRERWGIEAANLRTARGLALAARMKAGSLKRRLFGQR